MAIVTASQGRGTRRKRLIGGVVVGGVILLVVIFLAIPANRRRIANPAGQPAVVGATEIEVRGDGFQGHVYAPSVTQVQIGSTIRWTFNDRGANGTEAPIKHNVVGDGWASPLLAEGSYEHTFTAPGTYRYVCSLHSGMDGVVVVTR